MRTRLTAVTTHPYARAIGLGLLAGLILLALALIWRSARSETVILEVRPAGDTHLLHVYVGGEVNAPGLYALPRGSRVADAVAAAGGITSTGDTSGLGMAAPLRDADQIIVASARAAEGLPSVQGGSEEGSTNPVAAVGTININTADAAELETLPGIGPRIAERIIDHRQRNGSFRSVDELEAVQGISARMVEELRPLITTGP